MNSVSCACCSGHCIKRLSFGLSIISENLSIVHCAYNNIRFSKLGTLYCMLEQKAHNKPKPKYFQLCCPSGVNAFPQENCSQGILYTSQEATESCFVYILSSLQTWRWPHPLLPTPLPSHISHCISSYCSLYRWHKRIKIRLLSYNSIPPKVW